VFEAPPEQPSHFAFYWVLLIGAVGGFAGMYVGVWLFGEARFQTSDVALFGSFIAGAILGVVAGWKLVMPSRRPSSER
jgi:H+/Cl- antiporter ClcA